MKTIRVVATIIRKDNKIFATQRGYGDFKDGWEFPGGKIEEGESPEHAIAREIKEELNADIIVGDLLTTVEHDYPNFHLSMVVSGLSLPLILEWNSWSMKLQNGFQSMRLILLTGCRQI